MEGKTKKFPNAKNLKAGLSGGQKEVYNYDHGKNKELTASEYYTMAISTLTSKFHIVIHASGLQDYRNINRYHNLESKMNCIFLTDSVNENSPYFESNEAFAIDKTNDDYQQDSMVEISRKNKQLAKRMVELKAKIHNNILDFYEVVTVEDADQEVLEGLYANMIPSEDMKLEVIAGLI
jgi:hypothetical protein